MRDVNNIGEWLSLADLVRFFSWDIFTSSLLN